VRKLRKGIRAGEGEFQSGEKKGTAVSLGVTYACAQQAWDQKITGRISNGEPWDQVKATPKKKGRRGKKGGGGEGKEMWNTEFKGQGRLDVGVFDAYGRREGGSKTCCRMGWEGTTTTKKKTKKKREPQK